MNHQEMARLANDPAAVRASAQWIRAVLGDRLNDWEREFLAKLAAFDGSDVLSIRQRETLHQLRSRATRRSVVKGYRASTLVQKLWALRTDVSEEDEKFIKDLHEDLDKYGTGLMLSDNQWRYVFALCRELGEIERYVDVA